MKTVIIGGVAGGATAAARMRRRDEHMEILILERGEYISYANCGLPYHIGDVIKEREALLLQTPENMKARFNIDVRTRNEVMSIEPENKQLTVKDLTTGKLYHESYDKLIIATGSSPLVPPIEGIEAENIFTLWTVPQMDQIKSHIHINKPKRAAVIGGGFIGLEVAENLHQLGIDVTIVEMQDQVMAPLDKDMANMIHENLTMNGVELILGDGVKRFTHESNHENISTTIHLSSGKTINTDMVILSIGIRPNSQIAKDTGIKLNKRGGIIVDNRFKTHVDDIYAIGDVIQVSNFITQEDTMIPLAGPANKQGRLLADIITGLDKSYHGTMGTSVAQVFDYSVATTGLNEKQLIAAGKIKGKDYYTALIVQKSHAGYYPGATSMTLKMIFSASGEIFGAQIVGQDGVDKRIDTIAATIRNNGSVFDLSELELAYAPPFSSAKDPVNMLGFVAENILDGTVDFKEYTDIDDDTSGVYTVLDVSEDLERMMYAIPKSIHIPLGDLRQRMGELDKNSHLVIYCAIGVRSYNAARILSQNGFNNVSVLSGGVSFYKSMHYADNMDGDTNADATGCCTTTIDLNCCNDGSDPMDENAINSLKVDVNVNCSGLQCPGPIMKVSNALKDISDGQMIRASATDMGFPADIKAWCRRTGNTFLHNEKSDKEHVVYIRKGCNTGINSAANDSLFASSATLAGENQGKTIVVFSGDFDKVLASFIIANGAAAMNRPITMFFTFWGLNALRKSNPPTVRKPFMEKMFCGMMPRGAKKLQISKMNMGGMGTHMIRKVMRDKNVDSLETLMKSALDNGVRLVACTMSMDIMGITKEELIDGIEYAGVASYLGDAEESNVNLFI